MVTRIVILTAIALCCRDGREVVNAYNKERRLIGMLLCNSSYIYPCRLQRDNIAVRGSNVSQETDKLSRSILTGSPKSLI